MNLNNEILIFEEKLKFQLNNQDRFSTAEPVMYQIAEPYLEWGRDSDYCDIQGIVIGDDWASMPLIIDDETDFKDIKEDIEEYLETNVDAISNIDELESLLDKHNIDYYYIYARKEVKYHNAFLTHESAKKHLELNKYHYDSVDKPYIYCRHLWRNPELERLVKIIKKI